MSDVKQDILRLWEEKQLRITDEIQTAPEVLYANRLFYDFKAQRGCKLTQGGKFKILRMCIGR